MHYWLPCTHGLRVEMAESVWWILWLWPLARPYDTAWWLLLVVRPPSRRSGEGGFHPKWWWCEYWGSTGFIGGCWTWAEVDRGSWVTCLQGTRGGPLLSMAQGGSWGCAHASHGRQCMKARGSCRSDKLRHSACKVRLVVVWALVYATLP